MQNGQNTRLSYTLSYKGIVVGGLSDYHPEKIDFSLTKTIDYIEGETKEQTMQRLEDTKTLEELLINDVENCVVAKVKKIKSKMLKKKV